MKKTILIWVVLLTMSVTTTFANKAEGVSDKIMNSFNKEFVNAKDVEWEIGKQFVKATFKLNEQVIFAYYTPDGEQLAVSRNLLSSQLPINLLASLKNNYQEFWITDLFEMAAGNETSYFITLESADHVLVLKSSGAGNWQVFKKEKKQVD